jgi:lactate permease
VIFSLLVNAPFLPFFNLTFTQLSMPVEVIPGAPEKLRVFWQAYFWVLISTILALPILKPTRGQFSKSIKKWSKRFPRPMLAAAVFFAIALVINHSGKGLDWTLVSPQNNMIYILAEAASTAFGRFYPFASPFLGLFAGFISGSEASAIAMLTDLHLTTASKIGAIGLVVAAASGIGGGLASVISPAKLQNASASIDRIGEEAKVIPLTFVISLIITGVCAILTLIWGY